MKFSQSKCTVCLLVLASVCIAGHPDFYGQSARAGSENAKTGSTSSNFNIYHPNNRSTVDLSGYHIKLTTGAGITIMQSGDPDAGIFFIDPTPAAFGVASFLSTLQNPWTDSLDAGLTTGGSVTIPSLAAQYLGQDYSNIDDRSALGRFTVSISASANAALFARESMPALFPIGYTSVFGSKNAGGLSPFTGLNELALAGISVAFVRLFSRRIPRRR